MASDRGPGTSTLNLARNGVKRVFLHHGDGRRRNDFVGTEAEEFLVDLGKLGAVAIAIGSLLPKLRPPSM